MKLKSNHTQFLHTISKISTSKDSHAGKVYTIKTEAKNYTLLRQPAKNQTTTHQSKKYYNLSFGNIPQSFFFKVPINLNFWQIQNTREFKILNVPLQSEFKKTP